MIPLTAFLEAQARLVAARPDVLASGVGHRLRRGRRIPQRCLNVYVGAKKAGLARALRLPRSVRVSPRVRIPVDVQKWHASENQSAGSAIRDRRTQGCLGAYLRRGTGLFGLTAGHCILGEDGDLETEDPVRIHVGGSWRPLGLSESGIYEPAPGPEGFLRDHGLIRVSDPGLAAGLESHAVWSPEGDEGLLSLLGKPVFADSYLTGRVEGVVHNVCYREPLLSNGLVDVMFHSRRGLSRRGDSGKLWRLAAGTPLALHVRGNVFPKRPLSTKAFGCFLYKVEGAEEVLC